MNEINVGDCVTIQHPDMEYYGIQPNEVFNVAEIKYPLILLENDVHTMFVHKDTVRTLPTADESGACDE